MSIQKILKKSNIKLFLDIHENYFSCSFIIFESFFFQTLIGFYNIFLKYK